MDWSKAKNILIVSFLILNLLLVYRLYIEPISALATEGLSRERMEAIEQLLVKNGVSVKFALPRTVPRMPVVNIQVRSYKGPELEQMKNSILGEGAVQTSVNALPLDDQPASFSLGYEELVITARGYVTYYNRQVLPQEKTISEEEAKTIAIDFLNQRLGNTTDFALDSISYIEPMGYRVDFVQKYKGSYVFPGYIMMIVKPSGVAAMWMCRLDINSQLLGSRTIITAHEALLSLLSHRLNAGESGELEVLSMDAGYHSTIYDADQAWPATLVWRIHTAVGDFYINALSGTLEQ